MKTIDEEIQSSFKSEYHKLMVNLHLTSSRVGETIQGEMKKHGLTGTQFNVLRILRGQKKKPASIGLIKERMIERNSDVSRIIDRLHKKGLIDRTENKADRRQKDVVISDKGLKILEEIDPIEKLIDTKLGHLTVEEAETLNHLLDKARANCNS